MYGPRRSPARSRSRLLLEGLESRTLLSASMWDTLLATPQAILTPASLASVSADPLKKPSGGGGHGGGHGGGGGGSNPPGYSPSQIQTAYGFNTITFSNGTKGDGSGQSIAIVDAYNDANAWSDLSTFDTQYQLANPSLTVMNQIGTVLSTNGTSTGVKPPSADPSGGWEVEESLDLEWAHAMAPGAKIVLVEANSNSLSDLMTAVQTAAANAPVVSMSWGGGEFSGETSYDSYFANPNVTFVAASGDSGAPSIYPAVSPNVVAVGGTSLTLNGSGGYGSESGWSGSGGGISADETRPSYQPSTYSNGATTGTSTMRMSPDVAYNANPNTGYAVYDSTPYYGSSGWFEVGGTSAGAPQWSALIAIADQGRALNSTNNTPLSGVNQTLPTLYTMASGNFHDITGGTSTGSPNYTAGTGYDLVTGRGTPVAGSVVAALVNVTSAASVSGLIVTKNTGTSAAPADIFPGGGGLAQAPAGSGGASLSAPAAMASGTIVLVAPTPVAQTSALSVFPSGAAFGSIPFMGSSPTPTAAGASSAGLTAFSPAVPRWQIYAAGPKSAFSPSTGLGTSASPFHSESADAVPLSGADDVPDHWVDRPLPRSLLFTPFPKGIDLDLAPAFLNEGRFEGTPVDEGHLMDEAGMGLIDEESLGSANGDNENSFRLRGPSLAILGVLVSCFWMAPDAADETGKRRKTPSLVVTERT